MSTASGGSSTGSSQGDEAVIEWTMTWRDPKSGEKRLNRGTEWFRIDADGKIAEVRAYHHGDKKNPQGDLLGFDHAGRGHTMRSMRRDWLEPGSVDDCDQGHGSAGAAPAVHRGARGAPRLGHPLRRARRSRPTSTSGRRRASSPASSTTAAASSGSSGLKYPTELGGQGGDYVHDAVWTEALAYSGAGGGVAAGPRRPHRDRHSAGLQVRHARPARSASSSRRSGREDQRPRDHRARRRLGCRRDPHLRPQGRRRLRRQRLQDLHHQRRPCRLPRLRREDDRGGRPPRHLVPDPRARHARLRGRLEAREDGLARLRHRRALLHRRRGPRREPAREGGRRLLPDHGQLPMGAAADGARRRRGDEAPARGRGLLRQGARGLRPPDRQASRRSATRSPRCRSRPRSASR